MRTLKLPHKKEPVKADDVREMVLAIRENNVTAGIGLIEQQTPNGKIISLRQQQSRTSSQTSNPRSFDLASGSAGKLKLVRCYYQIASSYVNRPEEPEFTPAAGNVCAVINTKSGVVTASMEATFNPNTPELMPVRIYVIDALGSVLCDCRGSQVVVHG
jgi:hypothetical protein